MTKRCFSLLTALLLLIATATADNSQAWWGYWNSSMGTDVQTTLSGGQTNCYVRLVAPNDLLTGTSLHGVRIYLSDKTAVTGVKAWASVGAVNWTSTQPDRQQKEAAAADLRDVNNDGQATEVIFDEPIDILPANNRYASIYVGVLISVDATLAAQHPCQLLSASKEQSVPNSCFIANADRSGSQGPLALQLLVSGGQLGATAVSPQLAEQPMLIAGDAATLQLGMRNDGLQAVESIDYTVSVGAHTVANAHADLPSPIDELGATFSVSLPVNMPTEAALHDLTVSVTRVNGVDNLSDTPQASTPQVLLQQYGLKRAVMEEYTGTWCPNCPRGDLGLHLLDSQFGDRFIGISIHHDDPMTTPDYDTSPAKLRFLDGYPSCAVDRLIACDPYLGLDLFAKEFLTDRVVSDALQHKVEADVAVEAAWEADGHTITAQAATTFWYTAATAHHQLAFVLVADGLTGTEKGWEQYNPYSGATDWDEAMQPLVESGRYLYGPYDHVAIDVAGIDNGLQGSISLPLTCGKAQTYVQRFDTSDNVLVQDPDRLSVVALLIDTVTGQIVNAGKAHVTGSEHSGIATATLEGANGPTAPHLYRLDGRAVSPAAKGLVIERRADGSVRKHLQ